MKFLAYRPTMPSHIKALPFHEKSIAWIKVNTNFIVRLFTVPKYFVDYQSRSIFAKRSDRGNPWEDSSRDYRVNKIISCETAIKEFNEQFPFENK